MIRYITFIILIVGVFLYAGTSPNTRAILSEISQTIGIQSTVSERVSAILADTEVQMTLARLESQKGKYKRDNAVFLNREKLLPIQKDRSYYHEWTVDTPGSPDRGARRIITGRAGEIYFTDDHYDSFTRIR